MKVNKIDNDVDREVNIDIKMASCSLCLYGVRLNAQTSQIMKMLN